MNCFSILNVRFPNKVLKLKQKHFKLTILYCVQGKKKLAFLENKVENIYTAAS